MKSAPWEILFSKGRKEGVSFMPTTRQENSSGQCRHDASVNIDAIPEIDFIISPLPADLGSKFDYVVASHVLEHVPDMLGWITTVFGWLSPGGRIILAIPDKRYCFDYLRTPSTTGAVLEAYYLRRKAPSFASIYDGFSEAIHFDTARAWREDPYRGPYSSIFEPQTALRLAREALDTRIFQGLSLLGVHISFIFGNYR